MMVSMLKPYWSLNIIYILEVNAFWIDYNKWLTNVFKSYYLILLIIIIFFFLIHSTFISSVTAVHCFNEKCTKR